MGVKDAAVTAGLRFRADTEDLAVQRLRGKAIQLDGGSLPRLHQPGIFLIHGDVDPRAGQVQHLGEGRAGIEVFPNRVLQIGCHHNAVDRGAKLSIGNT